MMQGRKFHFSMLVIWPPPVHSRNICDGHNAIEQNVHNTMWQLYIDRCIIKSSLSVKAKPFAHFVLKLLFFWSLFLWLAKTLIPLSSAGSLSLAFIFFILSACCLTMFFQYLPFNSFDRYLPPDQPTPNHNRIIEIEKREKKSTYNWLAVQNKYRLIFGEVTAWAETEM